MKTLIIGGTRFVGLAITKYALSLGHEVTVFHRSDNVPAGTEAATHVQGDRLVDLGKLAQTRWDLVIDVCAYRPNEVALLADALGDSIKKFVFVSTVSVYDDSIPANSGEDAQLTSTTELTKLDATTVPVMEYYGALKVLCEQVTEQRFTNSLIIRPTYVIGPNDYTDRFTSWAQRISDGGVVNAPEPKSASLQYIDVRDLAKFTVDSALSDLSGAFHVAAPSGGVAFGDVLQTIVDAVGGPGCRLNWISVEDALTSDETFPLWADGEDIGMLAMDTSKALAAGLDARPLSETVAAIRDEFRTRPVQ